MEKINFFILSGVFIYMAVLIGIGYYSSKKVKNMADFLVAGRRLPFYLAVSTLFATWFGAGPCMGSAGAAYKDGLLAVISDPFAAGVSLILAGFFYVGLLRKMRLLTITDVFGKVYSKGTEILASLLMVPVYIGWLGAQLVAMGYVLNVLTGIDPLLGIILGALIIIMYTYAGGMWAVTLTDFIQVTILVLGLFMIFPVVIGDVGGFSALFQATPKSFWHFFPQNADYNGWAVYVGQWAIMGLGCIVGQDLIQRSLASKNIRVAKSSAVWAGVAYIIIGMIPIFLGFAGRILIPDIADAEFIIPFLAIKFLSPLMLMLFLGALISAIMSSADSSLLAATSLITNNILHRLYPHISDRHLLRITRTASIFIAVISMLVALYVKQIYNLMVNSWATLLVAIFVPVTAALYWKKANTEATWVSMLAGTFTWIGYIILKTGSFGEVSDDIFYVAALYGGLVSLISYLLVTFFHKQIMRIKNKFA